MWFALLPAQHTTHLACLWTTELYSHYTAIQVVVLSLHSTPVKLAELTETLEGVNFCIIHQTGIFKTQVNWEAGIKKQCDYRFGVGQEQEFRNGTSLWTTDDIC